MKNFYKIITLIFIYFILSVNSIIAQEDDTKQKIRAGSFAKVMVVEEFSSLTADVNDLVKFINTEDIFIYETKAIPKNTIFYGEIEDVREPVQGKDGAVKIFIYKMETPEKKIYNLNAHIYGEEDNYIGGKYTQNIYYRKVPHYNQNLKPFLQAVPLTVLEMGKHVEIKPGDEYFVIFDKDVYLK